MTVEVSERSFEKTIECGLLRFGPDACVGDAPGIREEAAPYGEFPAGGYRKRPPEEYDPSLCLLPRDVIDFVLATQPKEWEKLKQHHGAAVTHTRTLLSPIIPATVSPLTHTHSLSSLAGRCPRASSRGGESAPAPSVVQLRPLRGYYGAPVR